MPIVTSQLPSVITSSVKHGQIDVEPDKAWKDALKKRIEEELQSMVDDAKKARDDEVARIPLDDPRREHLSQEYNQAMTNIRGLAQEQFQIELERERQERRWSNGQAMLPQWDHALKSEQQEIMDRIKEAQKESSSPVATRCPDELRPVEGSSLGEEQPALRKETANAAQSSPQPPPIPSKRTTERRSTSERPSTNGVQTTPELRPAVDGPPLVETTHLDAHPTSTTRPTEVRAPETRSVDIRPPVFGNLEVLPRELPPGLSEKAEKVFASDREREHERPSASASIPLPRRGSNAYKDDQAHNPSIQFRAAYFQSVPERTDPIKLPSVDDGSDVEEEAVLRPLERRASLRKPSVHERPMEAPVSRSIERQPRPLSERYTPRSPSGPIPQIWMPPKSPEDEINTMRSQSGLARRGSTASIRSNSSAGVRPSIVEAIPERADAEAEQGNPRTEETDQGWTLSSSAREKGKQGPPLRTEERYSTAPDHTQHYDEPISYSNPRSAGSGHRSDGIGPPPPNNSTRPMNRKASHLSLEERDQANYPPHAWLRSKGSFTSDDRGYPATSHHSSARPSSRQTPDDRDHYHDYSRPYPTPPISAREHPTYYYDTRTDSPYQPEQRSATYRAAMNPESPPKRRPSESRPAFIREPSYTKYQAYAPPEDEYPAQFEGYQGNYNDKYPSKYVQPSSAIPITRPRKHSTNDDSDWKFWGPDPPLYRREPRRDHRNDYYDPDREHDYRARDERDHEYNIRYRPPSYNNDIGPPRREMYGPRSPPSSYRNEPNHRFGGRETRHTIENDESEDSEDYGRHSNGRKRDYEGSWTKAEARRREAETDDPKLRDLGIDRGHDSFPNNEEYRWERHMDEEPTRDSDVKRMEEKVAKEAKKLEEEATRQKEEATRQKEEATRQKEEATRQKEEARMMAEQAARKEEEARKREEEIKRKEEEARRQEEEAREKEEEILRKEKEIRRKAEEVRMKEREAKKKEEEAKKKEQEAKRKEKEAKRKEEEAKKKEEEARRKEEELQRKEEEARRKEQEAKKKEQEVRRKEEEAKRKEEEVRRKEEEARKREEEARQKELEARQKEEAIRQREEELRKREEELKRRETEMSDRNEAEKLQRKLDQEERERQSREAQERLEQERRRHPVKDPERLEQERLQQEEFRKREEQIRRQKRQDSINAESNWAPPIYTHPSPPPATPSPAMGRSSDRNTSAPPSWTTWASSTKLNPTAIPSTPSQSSPSTTSKPRSGSTGSTFSTTSTFPTSTSPFSAASPSPTSNSPFSTTAGVKAPTAQEEVEWRRRQEEHFEKQKEQFRQEQERIATARQQQEGIKPLTKEDIIAAFETHNRQWAAVQDKADLRWRDFPWPLFRAPSHPEEIKIPLIKAYIESDHHPDILKHNSEIPRTPKDREKEYKSRIRDHMKKWHPDRFETLYMRKVIEEEREMVREGAGSVARALGELLSSVSR